jgi:hypothetical protein
MSRDRTMFVGFCVSLVLHAVLGISLLRQYAQDLESRLAAGLAGVRRGGPSVVAADRDSPWGEADGSGQASASSPGELPQIAPHQSMRQQPALSRDPVGDGAIADEPSMVQNAGRAVPQEPAEPSLPAFGATATAQPPAPVIGRRLAATQPALAAAEPRPVPAAPPPRVASGAAGGDQKAGDAPDPYPMSDRDSDPFSTNAYAQVGRNGKVDAHFGRKVRLTRPQLTLKGEVDVMTYPNPTVVLRLSTDEAGKVVDVSWPPVQSSGSNEIDTPVYVAAWHWWFEPPKDKDGRARPDTFRYGIVWTR